MENTIVKPSNNFNKDGFSVFGSGESILKLSEEDFKKLKEKTHLIFINYAPCNPLFEKYCDVLLWSDINVTNYLKTVWTKKPSYSTWSRMNAFNQRELRNNNVNEIRIKSYVDYFFNERALVGNYSIVWLLMMLQKFYSEKKILLFGIDGSGGKWYDKMITWDIQHRGPTYNIPAKVNHSFDQIRRVIKKENVFNCNLESKLDYFEKKNYTDIIGG